MLKWIEGKIHKIKFWNNNTFSLFIKADIKPYINGQFTKLSIINNDIRISRAYSFVNDSKENIHEFLIKEVPNGKLTSLMIKLKVGDSIDISPKSTGFFINSMIPKSENLWMFSTGTALGVFLSLLSDELIFEKHKTIILMHGVSHKEDLTYCDKIKYLQNEYKGRFQYIPIISQEKSSKHLSGRITNNIENIEQIAKTRLTAKTSQAMICGNPNMIISVKEILINLGFKKCSNLDGNITFERYW